MIRNLHKEPLVHFLIGGAVLYAIHGAVKPPEDEGRQIVIDKPALLNFVQYRSKLFRPELFEKQLDQMPREEFDKLVKDYVDEEVLYREARSYQLERGDDVIRQRLIQKSQFLIDDEDNASPTDAELRKYFEQNRDRYITPPSLTFTHVFLDSTIHGKQTEQFARETMARLNRGHVGFSDAPSHGDRFPFLINYVDRPVDFVASQMGSAMTISLLARRPSEDNWQGPFQSPYGWHVVLLVKNSPASRLRFDQVRDEVRQSYLEDRRIRDRQQALDRLRKQYQVKLDIDRPGASAGG